VGSGGKAAAINIIWKCVVSFTLNLGKWTRHPQIIELCGCRIRTWPFREGRNLLPQRNNYSDPTGVTIFYFFLN